MKPEVAGAALAALIAGLGSAASAAPAAVITNPDWAEKPTGEQLAHAYPVIGELLGLTGRAVIRCEVEAIGRLKDCKVVSEAPAGLGFGEGALEMTPYFRMSPKREDGRLVDGAEVTIPITFSLGPPPSSEATARPAEPPVTQAARDLARQIVAIDDPPAPMIRLGREGLEDRIAQTPATVTAQTKAAAAHAVVSAMDAHLPDFRDSAADLYARRFSEAELREILAFMASPTGRKYAGMQEDVLRLLGAEVRAITQRIQADARAEFCANFDCRAQVAAPIQPPAK